MVNLSQGESEYESSGVVISSVIESHLNLQNKDRQCNSNIF